MWALGTIPPRLILSGYSFASSHGVSWLTCTHRCSAQYWRRALCGLDLHGCLFVQLSSLLLLPGSFSLFALPGPSAPSPQHRDSAVVIPPCLPPRSSLQAVCWGSCRAYIIGFPVSQESHFHCLMCSVSKTVISSVFLDLFLLLFQIQV